jgi:hypothetical protein
MIKSQNIPRQLIEWVNMLPEDTRNRFLENWKFQHPSGDIYNLDDCYFRMSDVINHSLAWDQTKERHDFWALIYDDYLRLERKRNFTIKTKEK